MMQTNLQLDLAFNYLENTGTNIFLTGKASSWPRKTQTPEMELLLLVPKRITLAKAFFLSLSSWWNILVMRLQLMEI